MIWILEVLEGPRRGTNFKLLAGLSIGRKTADINLDDAKISSIHAAIEEFPGGSLVLVDKRSRNGMYVDGQRVQQVKLEDGLIVQMGRCVLQVRQVNEEDLNDIVEAPGHWRDVLTNFNQSLAGNGAEIKQLRALNPIVELEIIEGQQISTHWILGYGPRKVGRHSLDFPIQENGAPEICFQIHPNEQGRANFSSDHPDLVKLNGTSVASQDLKNGDLISIGDTLIKVRISDA